MNTIIPIQIQKILNALLDFGYEAYPVGGCVRDTLLGNIPSDWDITTSALPQQIKEVFSSQKTIDTGLRHGTITVFSDDNEYAVEVTTYRTDGEYTDHRHPDTVIFTQNLSEDLSRRDFTINAMALSDDGCIDLFGGKKDLIEKTIRCVGSPEKRFEEDALRILRGLRFASVLGFSIEEKTAKAMDAKKHLLQQIAPERIRSEFMKLLCGKSAAHILREYSHIIGDLFSELLLMKGIDQKNPHHIWDVWEHTLHALENTPPFPILRFAVLYHDIGKPESFFTDENGVGHFYNHEEKSRQLAKKRLDFLKIDSASKEEILFLIKYHGLYLDTSESLIKHRLNQYGWKYMRNLIIVKRADASASADADEKCRFLDAVDLILSKIDSEQQCFSLKDLKINGNDLKAFIKPGPEMGNLLSCLLNEVIDGKYENDHKVLVCRAKELIENDRFLHPLQKNSL